MFPACTCVTVAGPSFCDIKRFVPELFVGQLVLFYSRILASRLYEGPSVRKSALIFVSSLSAYCVLLPKHIAVFV